MFPKRQRLTAGQVKEIFGSTKPKYDDFLKIYAQPSSPTDIFQVAVIVPKALSKKAYVRNRLRRRVYNALRTVVRNLPVQPTGSLVLMINKPIDDRSHQELETTLDRLFR